MKQITSESVRKTPYPSFMWLLFQARTPAILILYVNSCRLFPGYIALVVLKCISGHNLSCRVFTILFLKAKYEKSMCFIDLTARYNLGRKMTVLVCMLKLYVFTVPQELVLSMVDAIFCL